MMHADHAPYIARGIPILGALLRFHRDPLATVMQLSRAHGGLVQLKRRWYFVSSPADVQRVLAGPVRYTKGAFSKSVSRTMVDPMQDVLGEGLLTSEGELWKRQRRLAQPAFHKQRVRDLVPAMVGATQQLVERWTGLMQRREPVDAVEEMRRVALDTMGRTVFSLPLERAGSELSAALIESVVITNDQFWSLIPNPAWLPTARNRRWKQLLARINAGVHEIIAQRRR
jgi:cytochrome P450